METRKESMMSTTAQIADVLESLEAYTPAPPAREPDESSLAYLRRISAILHRLAFARGY